MFILKHIYLLCLLLAFSFASVTALPVRLGEVEIGLKSFDGYQEGTAYLSTDEDGSSLEILIVYRGFGLDEVIWTFSSEDFVAFREASAQSAWWRSRLLEMTVDQTVLHEVTSVTPVVDYRYRSTSYPFEATKNILQFLRQGSEYALLLTEMPPGAETRRFGEKTLPVFTVHFSADNLPILRDIISEESVERILDAYRTQKDSIETILAGSPK